MDYSLLLGLDSGRKELVVGIVDSIGNYNLWKTIESRGKLALTRGGEVTVVSYLRQVDRPDTSWGQADVVDPTRPIQGTIRERSQ